MEVAEIAQLVLDRPPVGEVRLVTIDGRSGAGKTYLAEQLATALGGAPIVHLDDICPGWNGLSNVSRIAADTIAKPLQNRRSARWRQWDWKTGGYGEEHETLWAPIFLLEGCGAGTQPLRSYASTSIWIEEVVDVRQNRIKGRNDWPGYEEYADFWATQEDELYAVDRTREHADLVVGD